MRFGLHSGQHHTTLAELSTVWARAAGAGFDACYLFDHFRPLYSDTESFLPEEAHTPNGPCLEAFTTLAALARSVPGVGVGIMVAGVGYRPIGLLEHSIATLDELAPGRMEFGLGAGWFEREYREYGYPFPPAGERLDQLQAGLATLRERFDGRVKLWTAGTGEKRTLPIAARYADAWNAMWLTPEEFKGTCAVLDAACVAAGRDPAAIERSIALRAFCSPDGSSARESLEQLAAERGADPVRLAARSLCGTPSECAAQLSRYADSGANHVAVMVHPPYDLQTLDLLGSEVLPLVSPA